jgi:hypothetical protein
MGISHLIRTGLMGVVGHYDATDFRRYPRDSQVIVRTDRGLEAGFVICELESAEEDAFPLSGQLLRLVSDEDLLILQRLERYRDQAFAACERLIAQRGLSGLLVDVEHTFDGQSVYFYFLGEITPELESITDELGTVYERKVCFKKFSETLAKGCGPNCGTGEGNCSSSGCATCSIAGGCRKP